MPRPNQGHAPRLATMIAARDRLIAERVKIHAAISREAHATTRNDDALPPTFGRHTSDWSPRHERAYQANIMAIATRRMNEIGALSRKIDRQSAAINAAIVRIHRTPPRQVTTAAPMTRLAMRATKR